MGLTYTVIKLTNLFSAQQVEVNGLENTGVIPIEAMDLIVDPLQQVLTVNPQHPNYPVTLAK